jgi:uncharacterized protein YlxP (DUF503 family)
MWVGVGKIILDFYNNEKVSIKQRALEKLCKDIRREFNVSALEVEDFDDLERCVIGFSAVLPQTWNEVKVQKYLEKVCKKIDATSVARVTTEDTDFFKF